MAQVVAAAAATHLERLERRVGTLRKTEASMRARWIADEEGWGNLPARAWPAYQPEASLAPVLRSKMAEACATGAVSAACNAATTDLAACLVFSGVDPTEGLSHYRGLAAGGDPEAMAAAGIVLTEGLGVDADETEGVRLIRAAAAAGSLQGAYELGCLHYMGAADVEEDLQATFFLMETAAARGHVAATFLLADLLIDAPEAVCEPDYDRALDLLVAAGEKGHRFARQHVLAILDGRHVTVKQGGPRN